MPTSPAQLPFSEAIDFFKQKTRLPSSGWTDIWQEQHSHSFVVAGGCGRRAMNEKPLFIPLKKPYFEAFEAGTKIKEFRPYGPRWNERTCAIGRQVVLSLGYGKQRRLSGVVAGFERSAEPTKTQDWRDWYGDRGGDAACILVALDD